MAVMYRQSFQRCKIVRNAISVSPAMRTCPGKHGFHSNINFLNMKLLKQKLQNLSCSFLQTHTCMFSTGTKRSCNRLHNLDVAPFGVLNVQTSNIDFLKIISIDPQKYPCQTKCFVALDNSKVVCKYHVQEKGLGTITLTNNDIASATTTSTTSHECEIAIPVKYDLNINLENSSRVVIGNLENESITVQLKSGNCHLQNIKSLNVTVSCEGGDIVSETLLQGNTTVSTTGSGTVTCEKILGHKLKVTTDNGAVRIDDLYADDSNITTNNADVRVGNTHRNTTIEVVDHGNITVDTVDGDLECRTNAGDIDVYLLRHENVELSANRGNITLKVPESVHSHVILEASDISLDDQINDLDLDCAEDGQKTTVVGTITEDSISSKAQNTIHAYANMGWIKVITQSWLQSLRL